MLVIRLIEPILNFCAPLTNPLTALAIVLLLSAVIRRTRNAWTRAGIIVAAVAALFAAYHLASSNPSAAQWLAALNTPLVAVFLVIILPAMYLPRGRAYRFFLLLPAALIILAVAGVADAYHSVPNGEFCWFLIRPSYLMAGTASLLVLIEPWLSLKRFRLAVRTACLLVLVYGGFALRQNYADYQAMRARRPQANEQSGLLNLSETSPVLLSDRRMTYLPSAPCRFTADGGYVQGCNLELYQRIMMVNYKALAKAEPNPAVTNTLGLLGGTLALFLIMSFVGARWFCGWLCPLSAIGGVLDWLRRTLRLNHFKPSSIMKRVYLCLGLGLAVLGLLMSAAFPYLDEQGKFAGVKIPQYAFCKICPSERVCPVVASGPEAYPPLPTTEWAFGFFRYASMATLALFLLSFAAGRRFWCRLCPMGMISGLFNRGGMFRLTKNTQKCNQCGICADACPMDIDLVRAEMEHADVSTFDCVLCLKCVDICPRDGCLTVEHGGIKLTESRFTASIK